MIISRVLHTPKDLSPTEPCYCTINPLHIHIHSPDVVNLAQLEEICDLMKDILRLHITKDVG